MNDDKNDKDQKAGMDGLSRRKFFTVVGNSAVGVAALGGLGVTWEFLSPNVLLELPTRFKVGAPQEIQPNTVVYNPQYRVFIFRDQSGFFYAVSSACTHLGCTSNWKSDGIAEHPDGVITCPCHGSIFSKTGEVIRGPAPRPLDRFRMRLEDGQLVVDTGETVNEEEMILKI